MGLWVLLCAGCVHEHKIGIVGGDASVDAPDEVSPDPDAGIDPGVDHHTTDGYEDPDATGDPIHDPGTDPLEDAPTDCIPPSDTWTHFTIDGTDWPREDFLDFTVRCTVSYIDVWVSERITYHLDCWADSGEESLHQVEISCHPWIEETGGLPRIAEGSDYLFRYLVRGGHPPSRWFTISTLAGQMLMAGIDAETFLPPGRTSLLEPVRVESSAIHCPIEYEECYDPQRLALDFMWNAFALRVFDGHYGVLGSSVDYYNVLLENATVHHHPLECGEATESWYKALIYRMPYL
jgi:hypothetical protein